MNLYDYIDLYGEISFLKKGFNDVENIIFSSLAYLDFDDIVPSDGKRICLKDASSLYFSMHSYENVSKEGIAQKQGYSFFKKLSLKKRYQSVLMSYYIYEGDKEKQFSALRFDFPNQQIYISYEGTDDLISGWREDFELSYQFPTKSQERAIRYLNNTIQTSDDHIIVGGHSKGGNLALVASMYAKNWIQRKIIKIYNNDGPGILEEQFYSKDYLQIKNKLTHIIPNFSVVGILLFHDYDYMVVKSSKHDLLAHSLFTWQIKKDHFVLTNLSKVSQKLERSIAIWLSNHNREQRKKMIVSIFQALDDSGITILSDFFQVKKAIRIIKKIKEIDPETKKLFYHFLKFNVQYLLKE